MAFTSFKFLVFILGVFFVYFIFPKKYRWTVLLAASLGFYWLSARWMTLCIVGTSLVVWGAGLWLQRLVDEGKAAQKTAPDAQAKTALRKAYQKKRRGVLMLVLAVCIGLLALFKYAGGLTALLDPLLLALSGGRVSFSTLAMPLGISFYTFMAAGYCIDVYRGRQQAERNPLKLLLFMSFFPSIMQGPISRYDQLAPQLTEGHSFCFEDAERGVLLIGWGFIKKLILADRLYVLVDHVFTNFEQYGGAVMVAAGILYGVQIYADFSGGINITMGVARILGIRLTPNFARPYFSTSLSDFWRRWHITLGAWMRDYLFYPISLSKPFARLGKWSRSKFGSQGSKVIVAGLASFIVFFVVGIWHGADMKYVAYGLYNGTVIMLATLCEPLFERFFKRTGIDPKGKPWHVFQIVRTFVVVLIGRFFTRSLGVRAAFVAFGNILLHPQFSQLSQLGDMGLTGADFLWAGIALAVLCLVDCVAEFKGDPLDRLKAKPIVVRWLVYFAIITALILLIPVEDIGGDFIYAKF